MAHRTDADYIQNEHGTARFFVENRQVSGILLLATFALGIYGYTQMPKRKDPDIPVRVASVITQWPGATSEQVEQLVTGPIESTLAENPNIRAPKGGDFGIKSLSMPSLSIIQVQLSGSVKDSKKERLEPSAGRWTDQVQQRFRRHRGADADGCESAGGSDGDRSARLRD
jgi:multidrug efflux pump subunit AcrB